MLTKQRTFCGLQHSLIAFTLGLQPSSKPQASMPIWSVSGSTGELFLVSFNWTCSCVCNVVYWADMYRAALPSVDKEIHFLKDGSQHVLGNLKITDLQHQYAKGHSFLPFHANLLEVAVVANLLIAQVYPLKAQALKQSIKSLLTQDQHLQATKFFIANSQQRNHKPSRRQAGDNVIFKPETSI